VHEDGLLHDDADRALRSGVPGTGYHNFGRPASIRPVAVDVPMSWVGLTFAQQQSFNATE
jgi:hypothetical protein